MGRQFLENFGGEKIVTCGRCETYLTNKDKPNLISTSFRGSTGQAYLFSWVTNVDYSDIELKQMMTGNHWVRDVHCKKCKQRLGWMYELAIEHDQTYKEGKVILEKALIKMMEGIVDKELSSPSRHFFSPSSASTSSSSLNDASV